MAEPRKGRVGRQGRQGRQGRSVGQKRLREFDEAKGRIALSNAQSNNSALLEYMLRHQPQGADATVDRFGEEAVRSVLQGGLDITRGATPRPSIPIRTSMPGAGETRPDEFDPFLRDEETGEPIKKVSIADQMAFESKVKQELAKQRDPEFGSGRKGAGAAAYGTAASQAPLGRLHQDYSPPPLVELPPGYRETPIPGWTGKSKSTTAEDIEKAYEEGTPIEERDDVDLGDLSPDEAISTLDLRDPKEGWDLFRHRWMPWGRGSGLEGASDPDVWSGRKDRPLKPSELALKSLWNTTWTTWDTFSLTMGESLINTKNLVTGNLEDIKPATIIDPQYGDTFLERVKSAKKKFDEKPFFEQLAFSFADPFILIGVTAKAMRITAKVLPKLAIRAGIIKPSAAMLKQLEQEKMLKLIARNSTKAGVLPSPSEITALSGSPRMQPTSRIGKALVGWWDPSALISNMTPGAIKATAQAALDFKKTLDIKDGYVQTMMAKVETRARQDHKMSFNDLFGTGRREPKATKITQVITHIPKRGFKDISQEALELVIKSETDPMDYPGPIANPGWYKSTASGQRQTPGYKDISVLTRIAKEHGIKMDYTTSADEVIDQLRQRHSRYANQGVVGVVEDLKEAPMFGDVFQDYKKGLSGGYVLNAAQKDMIKYVDEMLQEYLKMLQAEGIDIKELGSLDEAFTYFPRVVRDARAVGGKKIIDVSSQRTGGRGSIKKHRIHTYMDEQVLEKGGIYGDPLDALNTYFQAGYTEVATQRRLNQIRQYAKSMLPNEAIMMVAKEEKEKVLGMKRTLRDMGHVVSGLIPTAPLNRSMKRLFPRLANDIDAMNAMSPMEVREISSRIPEAVLGSAGITRRQFQEALEAASNSYTESGRDRGGWNLNTILPRIGLNRINEAGGTRIERLKEGWIKGVGSTEEGVQAFGEGADQSRNYQRIIREEFDKVYPGGKVTVYRARRRGTERGGMDRTGPYTNVSLNRSAALSYGNIEIDAIEIAINQIVAVGNEQVSELIVRSGAVLGEAAASFTTKARGSVVRGGQGTQRVHVGDMILEDALGRLSINPGAEQVITNSAQSVVNATLKKNRNRVLAARQIRKQMDEDFQKAKIVSARANREKRMAEANARGTGPTGAHVESLSRQLVFDKADAVEMNKLLEDNGYGVWKVGAEISGALRKFRTVFDVGAPFIHGLPLLMRNQTAWAKATQQHYATLFDPITGNKGLRSKYIAENSADITDFLKHGGGMGSSEFTETMAEGGWFAALPTTIGESKRVPSLLKPAAASIPSVINRSSGHFANSFESFLDAARIETWKGLRGSVDEKDATELASFVNKMTGTSSSRALGVPLSQQQFEAALPFFAPRYFRSISALMLDTFSGGLRGDQARKAVGSMLAGVVLVHIATQQALGQPIRLDPSKPSEFLRTDFMGQRVGFGTKPLSLIKSFVKISMGGLKDPSGFLKWNIMEQSTYEDNPILSTLRFGSAPLASNIFNVITGADPLGREMPGFDDPVGILGLATEQVSPFWLDAALEVAIGSHSMSGSIVAGGTEFGGAVSFPIPVYDAYNNELSNKAEEAWPDRSWEDIKEESETGGADEEEELLVRFPELRDLKWRARAASNKRVTHSKRVAFYKEKEQIHRDWFKEVNKAGELFESQNAENISATASRDLRESIKKASYAKRRLLASLEKRYPDIFEATNAYYEQVGESYPLLAAQSEFYEALSAYTDEEGGVIDPETDRVDYAAMDALKSSLANTYGNDIMFRINERLKQKRLTLYTSDGNQTHLNGTIAEYYDSFDVLEPYWEAYKEIVPPDQWDAWRKFDEASPNIQAALFKNPDFAEWYFGVLNKQYELLRDEPSIDLALVKFYGRSSKNKENWAKGIQAVRDAEKTVIQP